MPDNYRQSVSEWASRHPQWPVKISYTVSGPEHNQRHVCTYTLNGTTELVGDEMTKKVGANESAAKKAFVVCQLWERTVGTLL